MLYFDPKAPPRNPFEGLPQSDLNDQLRWVFPATPRMVVKIGPFFGDCAERHYNDLYFEVKTSLVATADNPSKTALAQHKKRMAALVRAAQALPPMSEMLRRNQGQIIFPEAILGTEDVQFLFMPGSTVKTPSLGRSVMEVFFRHIDERLYQDHPDRPKGIFPVTWVQELQGPILCESRS